MFDWTANTQFQLKVPQTPAINHALACLKRDVAHTLTASTAAINAIVLQADQTLTPEQYRLDVSATQMTLSAADELGFVYGLFALSQQYLRVMPFWWFSDQQLTPKAVVAISEATQLSTPATVRYRGWFVNDETLLNGWRTGADEEQVWARIYETLLRLGGNMIIPGTGSRALHNRATASEWGLFITHHHAEPLGAEMFAVAHPDLTPSYTKHQGEFEALWETAVKAQAAHKTLWTIGFRGQGDVPFWTSDKSVSSDEKRGALIAQVMQRQMAIVKKYVAHPVFVTNLYGEIMALYQKGVLLIPANVIKIWADNGYGKMVSRRQWNDDPRVPALPTAATAPGNGIYYHASFHDLQAASLLTPSVNSLEFMAEEVQQAFAAGAKDYVLVNCGNIKPFLYQLVGLATLWQTGKLDVAAFRRAFVAQYYHTHQVAIAEAYAAYGHAAIQFGPHADNLAGDEFYHNTAKQLVAAWFKQQRSALDSLCWLDRGNFAKQVDTIHTLAVSGTAQWQVYLEQVQSLHRTINDPHDQQLVYDHLELPARLHLSGSKGLRLLTEAYQADAPLQAFQKAYASKLAFQESLSAIKLAEHDHWQDFYWNDCQENMRLTVYTVDALVRYLRVVGDGPQLNDLFNHWEKQQLWSAGDRHGAFQTAYYNQLSDAQLYVWLKDDLVRNNAVLTAAEKAALQRKGAEY